MSTVCYVGNVGAGSPDFSTENDLCRSFEELGWVVDPYPEREFMKHAARGQLDYDRFTSADLVMHTMTQGSYPDPGAVLKLWDACREAGVPTASYHLDLFHSLSSPKDSGPQRSDLPRLHPMFKVDYVCTADGDHEEEFKRDGVNHYFVRPGVRTEHAHDSEAYPPWVGQWDVAFIGSSGYHPEWPHRPQLVQWLHDTYGERFIHIGPGTTQYVEDDSGNKLDRLRGHWLNRFLASVKVTVGDSCMWKRSNYYTSDRPYETYGRGGLLIHPGTYGLGEALGHVPGHDWNCGDWDALKFEVDRYVADDIMRETDRQRIAAEVRANHTYTCRVHEILRIVGLE